jgi:hypothetical protein
VEFKYDNCSPNVFTCVDRGASSFWKGVLWIARVAKFGYRWKLGNEAKVRFWEDVWVGTSSIAIQFWDIYFIVNEQNKTVAELWDGVNLRCTFRRCVDRKLFQLWEEVVSVASTIVLLGEEDALVWQYQSSRIYSSQFPV